MVPFTIAILRYAVDVDGGLAGEPEDIALRDRVLPAVVLGLDRNRWCCGYPRLTWPRRPPAPCVARPVNKPLGRSAGVPLRAPRFGSVCGPVWPWSPRCSAWGAWQRRWIADDGLIVLRTVRNLLGRQRPGFQPGRAGRGQYLQWSWTYLMYAGSWIGGPMRMEYVALALALVLSVLGVAFLMLGTGRLYAPSLRGRRAIMLPAGALVYIALPPARDFATSGLESGLVLAYLGLLWWMMVCWSQPGRTSVG
jgi:hypothetical protein